MTSQTLSKGEWLYSTVLMNIAPHIMANERIVNSLNWILERIFGDEASGDEAELEQLREEHGCEVPEMESSEQTKLGFALSDYFGSERPIRGIDVPVLMLYGDNELPFLEAHAEYLEAQLAQCRTAEIPDAGHNSQADNPEYILNRVREFTTQLSPASGSNATD
jgi:pimeloyl-ACP methyl ester carboxylesterase